MDKQVFVDPIQHSPAGKNANMNDITSGNEHEYLGLDRIRGRGIQFVLSNIAAARWPEHEVRVTRMTGRGSRTRKRRLAHLHALQQHPVERQEDRDLDDDGQAAATGLIFSR